MDYCEAINRQSATPVKNTFKVEAVELVRDRGVSVARAARIVDVHEDVLRKRVTELASDAAALFPTTAR
jgi:transposase-like protein